MSDEKLKDCSRCGHVHLFIGRCGFHCCGCTLTEHPKAVELLSIKSKQEHMTAGWYYDAYLQRENELLAEQQVSAGLRERLAVASELYAEMTVNRDQWERNSAAENRRAADALVTAQRLEASLADRDNHIDLAYKSLRDVNRAVYLSDHIAALKTELQSLRERQKRALACLRCSEDKKHAKMAISILGATGGTKALPNEEV